MKIAFDTNILVYAEGLNGVQKQRLILDLLDRLPLAGRTLPVNVLGELFNILKRKGGFSAPEARNRVLVWKSAAALAETTEETMLAALKLATEHQLMVWDALVLSASAEVGCRILLSEDFQDGFTWRGVTVVDPFAEPASPLLEGAMRS